MWTDIAIYGTQVDELELNEPNHSPDKIGFFWFKLQEAGPKAKEALGCCFWKGG